MAHETFSEDVQILKAKIAELEEQNNLLKNEISNREKWNALTKVAEDAIIHFDDNGEIIDVNDAFCSHVGLKKHEIISKPLEEFIPYEKHYKLKRQNILLMEAGKAKGILPIVHRNGITFFDVITTRHPLGNLNISVMRDITHKKIMEESITNKDDLVKALFLQAIDGIVFWDLKGKVVNANSSACRIFESSHHEIVGKRFKEFQVKKDENYYKAMTEINETGAGKGQLFFTLPSGKEKLIEFSSRMHSVDGYHMTIFRDVSNRHRMEQELRFSELKCRKVFEGSFDGMILWDEDYIITDVNTSAELSFGISKRKIIGKSIKELVTKCPKKHQELMQHVEQVIQFGQHDSSIILEQRDGTPKHYDFSSKYNVVEGLSLTVFRDITEKMEMQEQLRKSDTLNVIGQLAAGIAHEIRNPMTALKGFVQLLKGSIKKEHEMYYQVITSELQRIDTIINEFLILAKPQAVRFEECDVTKIMKETVDLLGAQAVLHNVQFGTFYEDGGGRVFCEPNQLKKVFINIIKNAIEVMPEGGMIDISFGKSRDNKLHIRIKDEGIGIPPEKLKRLGEPFYTTKDRGTGLGLMVTYRIIEEHKGFIKVESEEGKGTVFNIYLPLIVNED
ncbi:MULTISPECIES: PAS domain-containing sensor histidine kinase [unclassified Bacillus (in: firmicutes)]|uniref:PAS domain-containing sensor histidine kinase n=1 Tax=unclassified Bacillus (in: firmicutes) TaxID=185979 RepID=UPI0008F3056E|nr:MULTISPECIES: PAS domain-containing sensor histidine kinase [unclassified Bacillus (in: firmicutes)]SFA77338.1 two-component system, sporulation sensor kinase E [Bacillus sp. UNCCL13]SFQ67288.1 two-component system, sporulation sensor kinase E [Bacillus sp. cl95]